MSEDSILHGAMKSPDWIVLKPWISAHDGTSDGFLAVVAIQDGLRKLPPSRDERGIGQAKLLHTDPLAHMAKFLSDKKKSSPLHFALRVSI